MKDASPIHNVTHPARRVYLRTERYRRQKIFWRLSAMKHDWTTQRGLTKHVNAQCGESEQRS